MFRVGMSEILVLLLIVLLLFGAKRLPEIGKALGKTLKEFRKVTKNLDEEDDSQSS
ncbi:MAG: twin-arginine translocase TatA/TatE family subunit [Candidatus Saelkia tenebricola]|nr:twin-arginine translocase TatA/TatE family subunit [Candidatus Saelkia tenebricola]